MRVLSICLICTGETIFLYFARVIRNLTLSKLPYRSTPALNGKGDLSIET